MLTLLFTMFSNYCSQGPREPLGGDTWEVAPKPPVRPSALSLAINKSNTRFYLGEETGQINSRDQVKQDLITVNLREVPAIAGPHQGQSRVFGALHQPLQALPGSPGEREPASRLPHSPTGGPLGLPKPDFPAKQIPGDFYEQALLK